jgi:hypothetical protein
MPIQSTVLTTTAANIFASTTTTGDVISVMYFCNRSAAPTTIDLHIVPAGASANVNNIAYSNKTIASNDTYIVDLEKILLSKGDTLQARANTGNAVVVTVSSLGV